jgi:peptidoglycan hydrolase-like protein with peptidoglycan-binding domain
VNNAGPEIPGCGNSNTGFSTASGVSCVGNRITSGTPNAPGASGYNFGIGTLKNGSKGAAVKELQRFLNDKLNLGLVIDGKLGPKTIAVIKKWQLAHGLVADGFVGPLTKAKMYAQ